MNICSDLITIIVPTFNTENFIKRSITSLFEQTYSNIEILVIDDNSTDRTVEICQQLQKKDGRLKIISKKENKGVANSRNLGIKNARGKYIMFVDSDDYVDKNFCLIMLNAIKKFAADIAFCNYISVDRKRKRYVKLAKGNESIINRKLVMKTLITASFLWNKIFSRKLFKDINFPEGVNYEDIRTLYKIIDKANKVVYEPAYLYFYEQRENSIVHTNELNNNIQYFEAIAELASFFKSRYPSLFYQECFYLMPTAFGYCMNNTNEGDPLYIKAEQILKSSPIPKEMNFLSRLELGLVKKIPCGINILRFIKNRKVYKWIRKDH